MLLRSGYACDREGGKNEREDRKKENERNQAHIIQQRTVINYEPDKGFFCYLNYNFAFIKFITCSLFCFNTVQKLNNPVISLSGFFFYSQSYNSAQPYFVS